jgi:hypothetical protein
MDTPTASKAARLTGWVMTILPSLLFAFSGIMKLAHPPALDEGFAKIQLPVSWAMPLGILELTCLVVYLIPRTAVIGAILLTRLPRRSHPHSPEGRRLQRRPRHLRRHPLGRPLVA